MVTRQDLKQIVILSYLADPMLDKLLPYIRLVKVEEGDVIFKEGDPGEIFYMVKQGKIVLEQRISDKIRVSVASVKSGYSFGWSAMLGTVEPYTLDAICAEASEVFSINQRDIRKLLEEDHTMGYLLMQRIVVVVKNRLDRRTEQFLKVITAHPDIKPLMDS